MMYFRHHYAFNAISFDTDYPSTFVQLPSTYSKLLTIDFNALLPIPYYNSNGSGYPSPPSPTRKRRPTIIRFPPRILYPHSSSTHPPTLRPRPLNHQPLPSRLPFQPLHTIPKQPQSTKSAPHPSRHRQRIPPPGLRSSQIPRPCYPRGISSSVEGVGRGENVHAAGG